MLIKFAIDNDALSSNHLMYDSEYYVDHLLQFWGLHGILVDSDGSFDQQLADPTFLTDSLRKDLQDAYELHLQGHGSEELRFVGESLAKRVELNGQNPCEHYENIELTITPFHRKACQTSLVYILRSQDIPLEQTAEELWEHRFQRYAQYSEDVVLIDRYAVRSLTEDAPRKGLLWMLRFLARDASNCRFTVFSTYEVDAGSWKGSKNPQDGFFAIKEAIESEIHDLLDSQAFKNEWGQGIEELNIFLLRHGRQGKQKHNYFHDRRLRFDYRGFTIGAGIDVLSPGRRHGESPTLTLKEVEWVNEMKDLENLLQRECNRDPNLQLNRLRPIKWHRK